MRIVPMQSLSGDRFTLQNGHQGDAVDWIVLLSHHHIQYRGEEIDTTYRLRTDATRSGNSWPFYNEGLTYTTFLGPAISAPQRKI